MHYGFIGLGLIGGSIARGLREKYPECMITAYDMEASSVEAAKRDGVVNICAYEIDRVFSACGLIFLCAPVSCNADNLLPVRNVIAPDALLTDVGSVKGDIHAHVRAAGLERQFIGGHPMTGSERTGYLNSKAGLLENAYYILTPGEDVAKEKTDLMEKLVRSLGAIPLILSAREHDYVTAGISHLPHVIAASLVNLVRESDSEDGIMKMVAAGGFKDITRIASSQAGMWQQICLTNGKNISSLLSDYIDKLTVFREFIDNKTEAELYSQFENARVYRDSFINASSGPIKRSFAISVEIADKSGALAHIVTLLAENGLSIKNIGITHNRESDDGVLKVEFYDENALKKAVTVLNASAYAVHVRS